MIKFFRKIRQNLLQENQFRKYILYALGEIVLVVIGILIALQLDNKSELNKLEKKELVMLENLLEDLKEDFYTIKLDDSLYQIEEQESKFILEVFQTAKSLNDFDTIIGMEPLWNNSNFKRTSYDEMIATGSFYNLKNKELQRWISRYYQYAEDNEYYLDKVSEAQAEMYINDPNFRPYKYLVTMAKDSLFEKGMYDDSWINNPKHPTFLAVWNYLLTDYETNILYRRRGYKMMMDGAEFVSQQIQEELNHRRGLDSTHFNPSNGSLEN